MNIINTWQFWVIIYLFSAIMFSQSFRKSNRNMNDAGSLTILLEVCTGIVSLIMMPIFVTKFNVDLKIISTILMIICIYAITDRLNIEARYGLETSTYSMVKRLSTVFMIIFGFIFLKEEVILNKVFGALIIIIGNIILTYNKGKFEINKYFIMATFAQLLFAIAMIINVGLSSNFNLAFYTYITTTGPAILISLFGRHSFKDLNKEFKLCDKKFFIVASIGWALMLNSSIRAYQLGSVVVVASLFSLTPILNSLFEFIVYKNKERIFQKIIVSILLIIGVILVNL